MKKHKLRGFKISGSVGMCLCVWLFFIAFLKFKIFEIWLVFQKLTFANFMNLVIMKIFSHKIYPLTLWPACLWLYLKQPGNGRGFNPFPNTLLETQERDMWGSWICIKYTTLHMIITGNIISFLIFDEIRKLEKWYHHLT